MIFFNYAEIRRLLADNRELKSKITDLEQELRDERERNRRREDDLLNQCLLATGRYGIDPAKPKPAPPPRPYKRPHLNAMQDATLQAYRQEAIRTGRSIHEAEEVFWAEIEGRPSPIGSPDEPYVVPS